MLLFAKKNSSKFIRILKMIKNNKFYEFLSKILFVSYFLIIV